MNNTNVENLSQQELLERLSNSISSAPMNEIINMINGIQDLDQPDSYGYTILNAACIDGREDIVRYLVENHLVDINKKGIEGGTSILCAAVNEEYEIVRYLAHHGADPNIPDDENKTAYDYLNDDQGGYIRYIANHYGYA